MRAPENEMFDVDGVRLHLRQAGDGAPAVVVEAGAGSPAILWTAVAQAVAEFTTIVTYDRAGVGWSSAPRTPTTVDSVAAALDTY